MLSCLLNNQRINCYDYDKDTLKIWANKNILICPACGKPYEYCHGKVISPYFRHKDKQECIDRYSEPETEEHKIGKQDLYEWIKKQDGVTDTILEGWIETTKQRPDIMFKYNGEQYVIEYQCSPISSEYYERHELYQASNIHDIWICGVEKYFGSNKRLNTLEKESKLYYDIKNKDMYCNMYYFDDFLLLSLKDNNKYKESLIDEYKDSENKIHTIDFCLDKENLNNLSFKYDIIFKEIYFRFEKISERIEKHFKELDFEEHIEDYIIFLIDNKKEILEKINNINKRLKKYNCVIEIDKGNFNKNNRSYWVIARIYYKYKNYKFSINRLNLYSKHFYRDVNEVFFSKNLSEILNYIDNYYLNFENKVIKKKNFITYSKIIKKVVNSFCKKYKNNKYFEISFDKLNQEDKTKLKFYYSEYCNDKYYNGDECSLLEIDSNYNYCLVYTDLDNYKEIQINNDSCVDEVISNLEYYKNIVLNKYLKVLENKNIVRFLERK